MKNDAQPPQHRNPAGEAMLSKGSWSAARQLPALARHLTGYRGLPSRRAPKVCIRTVTANDWRMTWASRDAGSQPCRVRFHLFCAHCTGLRSQPKRPRREVRHVLCCTNASSRY